MPLSPRNVGFRFSARVETLSVCDVLELVCPNCSKKYMIAPYQLRLRFRPSLHLNDVGARFRCRECGFKASKKSAARWAVYTASTLLQDVENTQNID